MRTVLTSLTLATLFASGALWLGGDAVAGSSATVIQSDGGGATSTTSRRTGDGGQTITRRSGGSSATIEQSPGGRATIEQNGRRDSWNEGGNSGTKGASERAAAPSDCVSAGSAAATTAPSLDKAPGRSSDPSSSSASSQAPSERPGGAGPVAGEPSAGAGCPARDTRTNAGTGVPPPPTREAQTNGPGRRGAGAENVGERVKRTFGFDLETSKTFENEFLKKAQ